MRVGIGITSYKRPEHLALCLEQIKANTGEHLLSVAKDVRGISKAKNHNIRELRECDYIFLFDDDCFPVATGWEDVIIAAMQATDQHHLLYLRETQAICKVGSITSPGGTVVEHYDNAGGCFVAITGVVLDKVGGYGKDYGVYGFEHAGYSMRIHQAGLCAHPFQSLQGIGRYIYSLDYNYHLKFNIKHRPSLSAVEMAEGVKENRKIFEYDKQTIFQALD